MRRAVLAVLAVVVVAVSLQFHAVPAAAVDRRPCVSDTEFLRFDFTWPKSRIHRFFDTAGKRDPHNTTDKRLGRRYQACGHPGGYVIVKYSRVTQLPTMAVEFTPN